MNAIRKLLLTIFPPRDITQRSTRSLEKRLIAIRFKVAAEVRAAQALRAEADVIYAELKARASKENAND